MTGSTVLDVMGAIGLVALVMMLVAPGSRGARMVRSIGRSWELAAASAINYGRT